MEYSTGLALMTTRQRMGFDNVKMSFLEWGTKEERERQEKYRQYRNYYDGEQDVMLTDRQAAFLELSTGQEFSANYCPLVVEELSRRLAVSGFDVKDTSLGGEDGILWDWWRRGRMDSKQSDVHLSAIRDGDTYVIVTWNDEQSRPEFHPNLAFNGYEGVHAHYSDETGEIVMASKRWLIHGTEEGAGERRRMNLYFADRVERYISDDSADGGAWKLFTGDGQEGVLAWVDKMGKPLGVPVYHLKYKPGGYRWGKSILEDVIPLQNLLNKAVVDVIAAADTTGFRLYWATGTDMTDEDGNPITIHPGTMLTSDSSEASFGFIPGEDPRPLIEVVDMCKVSIAQVSETPMHLFQVSGQNASEGAQKQQEVGMINKAEHLSISVGNFWEDCMAMGIRLANSFGDGNYDATAIIQTQWADMEIRDKTSRRKEVAETAKIWTDAGADLESGAREAGVPAARAKTLGELAIPTDIIPPAVGTNGDE